jgi:hypothetical protein
MHQPNPNEHARHDTTFIAAHAAGDLSDIERTRADALIGSCNDCAELRRDLVAIAAATRSVPAPSTLERDLRLSAEQAERLRRGSWLRAFLRPFAAARSPLRPAATAFTSLGVVGLLVGVTLSSAPAGPAAADMERQAMSAAPAAPVATAAAGGAGAHEFAAPTDRFVAQALGNSTNAPSVEDTSTDGYDAFRTAAGTKPTEAAALDGDAPDVTAADPGNETRSLASEPPQRPAAMVIAGSLALLGIGLLLFGLRVASRRVR